MEFCELRLYGVLEQFAAEMVHEVPWLNESLLRRPAQEDHRSPPAGRYQERGRPLLRSEPLLGAALRQDGRGGTLPRPEETPRLQAQDGRARQKAFGSGPRRTSRGHPL